mmetsp:Transcript_25358/g.27709  ORF Transcript_25358/g.27709 Transcript_25358/m.27709 type:complete len:156 (-) Transcript_25358:732-1199(-)
MTKCIDYDFVSFPSQEAWYNAMVDIENFLRQIVREPDALNAIASIIGKSLVNGNIQACDLLPVREVAERPLFIICYRKPLLMCMCTPLPLTLLTRHTKHTEHWVALPPCIDCCFGTNQTRPRKRKVVLLNSCVMESLRSSTLDRVVISRRTLMRN